MFEDSNTVILRGVPGGRRWAGPESKDPVECRAMSLGTPGVPSTALRPLCHPRSAQNDPGFGV